MWNSKTNDSGPGIHTNIYMYEYKTNLDFMVSWKKKEKKVTIVN